MTVKLGWLSQLDSKTETHKHQVQNDGVIATVFLGVVQFSDELCLTIFIGSTYVICHEKIVVLP